MGNSFKACVTDLDHVCDVNCKRYNCKRIKRYEDAKSERNKITSIGYPSYLDKRNLPTYKFYLPDDSITNNKYFHNHIDNIQFE